MRILLLLSFCLLLASCSRISLGYRFADWAVEDAVDDYLDLTSSQENDFEDHLDEYFKWHRKEMLPRYASYLEKIKQAVAEQNWKLKYWESLNQELEVLYYDTASPFKKYLSTIFVDMSDFQIKYLKKKLLEENEEKEEEYIKNKELRIRKSIENNAKLFKKWAGSITDEQSELVRASTQKLRFPVKEWLSKRQKQQSELIILLEGKSSTRNDFEDFIDRYLKQTPTEDTRIYYAELIEFRAALRPVLLEKLKSLSEKQRLHFIERLDSLIKDLVKLSRKGES